IGRNTLTNNGENAIDLKATDHIVISENTMSGYKPTAYRAGAVSGSDGSAAVINDDGKGPLQSWWINNFIHSSRVGIRNQAAGGVHALVGNVFMNIKKTALEAEPATTGSAAGVGYWQSAGAASVYLGNNTFFDVNGGIYLHNAATALVLNNLVSHLADHTRGWPVNINNAASIQVGSNLYYDPQGAVRRDTNALSLTDLVGLDPLFVNAAAYDIRLSPVSPALDRANNAYAEAIANHYVTLYGAGIRTDILGKPRPNGTSWDIGALEH
ncbi:MAG TPA: choice-of-anchor Q domain-containing protein, partial [Bdellovibrionales bacterium]|nr:choice-of-anchor Q domain-containing protein [Bdellovibrionales bacterium]